jgi:flagellar hook assembly protein FlgD
VRVLADGYMSGGLHTEFWDGTNSSGTEVSSGTYFYRLTAGKGSITRKMILLK